MPQISSLTAGGLAAALTLALAAPAAALDTLEPAAPFRPSDLVAPPSPSPDFEPFDVSDQALDHLSGKGIAVAITDQDLTSVSSGNTINAANVASGAINLTDNALAGFGGVGNFLMNTGHNNSLQSNVSVTIIVTQ